MQSWTDNAPKHWCKGRLKNLVAAVANGVWGEDPAGDGSDVRCIRAADFDRMRQRAVIEGAPLRSLDRGSLRRHLLQPGDLILEKSGGGERQPVGAAVLYEASDTAAVCSNFCARVVPAQDVDARFLTYAFAAAYHQGLTQCAIKQTTGIQNLDSDWFFSLPWAYPKLDEQRSIADFLDAETGKIDATRRKRLAQITLLEEREFARAYRALRGMNEPGPRVYSGLRWLGEIPAYWDVASVSSQFQVDLGKMLNQERTTGEYLRPYLRNTNVQWDRIDTDDLLSMNFPPHERVRYKVQTGDLLVCEGGQPGRAAIWDGRLDEVYYQKAIHRVRSRGRSRPRWLYYCLRVAAFMNVFAVEGNSTTIAHLTREQLAAHRFPFPSTATQDRLIRMLDEAHKLERTLIAEIGRQLDVLAERRQALITAAVTGQLDVTTARSGVRV